jgi:hypothetical protein
MVDESRLRAYVALLERAVKQNPGPQLYRDLARVNLDLGDGSAAAQACAQAVALDTDFSTVDPIIAWSESGPLPPETQVRRAAALIEHGFITSSVIAELVRAAAEAGDASLTRSLMDYGRFYQCGICAEAQELPHRRIIEIFNKSPSLYDEPTDRAIRRASRFNDIVSNDSNPEIALLRRVLRTSAERYLEDVRRDTGAPHPFTASIPSDFDIEAWAVISGTQGYHRPHIHHRAWAVGVLYLAVPECVADTRSRAGWLRIGPPDDLKHDGPAWEERWVMPSPGLLVMMPAFFWHESIPIDSDGERICVAFDIVPAKGTHLRQVERI